MLEVVVGNPLDDPSSDVVLAHLPLGRSPMQVGMVKRDPAPVSTGVMDVIEMFDAPMPHGVVIRRTSGVSRGVLSTRLVYSDVMRGRIVEQVLLRVITPSVMDVPRTDLLPVMGGDLDVGEACHVRKDGDRVVLDPIFGRVVVASFLHAMLD